MRRVGGGAGRWRGRGRWTSAAGFGTLFVLAALVDVGAADASWRLSVSLVVALLAFASLSLHGGGARALAVTAVTVSVAGSALLVAVGGDGTGLVEVGALLLLLAARWRSAATAGDRVLVGGAVVALLLVPARSTVTVDPGLAVSTDYANLTLVTVVGIALTVAAATALRTQDARRAAAVTAVRRAERAEIARELHDVVAHHVTGMVVATQAARTAAATRASPPVEGALAAIEDSGTQALGAMRRLVGVLRTNTGEHPADGARSPTPGLADLDVMVRRFRESGAAARVDLDVRLDGRRRVGPELHAAAYRVVREALTNAARYARGAERVRVAVTTEEDVLAVDVVDSGAGRAGTNGMDGLGGGFGVVGMRERVEALGGHLTAGLRPDGGWAVRATLPLRDPDGATVEGR